MKNAESKSNWSQKHLLRILCVSFIYSPGLFKRFLVAINYIEPWVQCLGYTPVSSGRSVSWGAAPNLDREKTGKKRDAGRRKKGRLVVSRRKPHSPLLVPPFLRAAP